MEGMCECVICPQFGLSFSIQEKKYGSTTPITFILLQIKRLIAFLKANKISYHSSSFQVISKLYPTSMTSQSFGT